MSICLPYVSFSNRSEAEQCRAQLAQQQPGIHYEVETFCAEDAPVCAHAVVDPERNLGNMLLNQLSKLLSGHSG